MESYSSFDQKRLLTGSLIGIILFILTAGAWSLAIFMVSILVFGCTKGPPDWVYAIVFIGFPIPLIITSIVVPYIYIKKQKGIWIVFTIITGIILSCLLFLIWFIILIQYC